MSEGIRQFEWPQWGPLLLGYSFEDEPIFLDEFNWASVEVQESLKSKTKTGVVAKSLIGQLAASVCRLPCLPTAPHILVDVNEVYDQIGTIEGVEKCRPLPTKKEEAFETAPFDGLWHKHWTQASWLSKNVSLEFAKFGMRDVMGALRNHYGPAVSKGIPVTDETFSLIAKAAIVDTFNSRTRRHELTGEWIMFAKLQRRNVYLTLATHDESKANSQAIVSRCKQAISEFPDLVEVPCLR